MVAPLVSASEQHLKRTGPSPWRPNENRRNKLCSASFLPSSQRQENKKPSERGETKKPSERARRMEPTASTSASPAEDSNLLRRQGAFEGADFVRLRLGSGCRARYLHAAEDGRSVRLDPRRESHNAVWAVTPSFSPNVWNGPCVLLRGAYGRYLGTTARGSLCYPFSTRCRAAKQCDYDTAQVLGIMWTAVATSREGAFLLKDDTARYLRANSRCLLPCCSGVHVSARGDLCTATKWAVERVPRAGRPELPIPPDSLFARLCPPLSRLCVLEREIRWVRADNNGVCSEDEWPSERYTGRVTIHLKSQLVSLLPPQPQVDRPDYTLCVRAGRFGQLSPLLVNLPRSREPLDLVLVERNTAADNWFIYPDVNAVAGAAAADAPVR